MNIDSGQEIYFWEIADIFPQKTIETLIKNNYFHCPFRRDPKGFFCCRSNSLCEMGNLGGKSPDATVMVVMHNSSEVPQEFVRKACDGKVEKVQRTIGADTE